MMGRRPVRGSVLPTEREPRKWRGAHNKIMISSVKYVILRSKQQHSQTVHPAGSSSGCEIYESCENSTQRCARSSTGTLEKRFNKPDKNLLTSIRKKQKLLVLVQRFDADSDPDPTFF
jgi:hypothetical protein